MSEKGHQAKRPRTPINKPETRFHDTAEELTMENLALRIKACLAITRSYGYDVAVVFWKNGWNYRRIPNSHAMMDFDRKSKLYSKISWHRLDSDLLNLSEFQD